MSRSFECYDCGDRTEKYDDAYCASCWQRRVATAEAKAAADIAETEAAAVMLAKMGFKLQADLLRGAKSQIKAKP